MKNLIQPLAWFFVLGALLATASGLSLSLF